jgi:hypothetical protein
MLRLLKGLDIDDGVDTRIQIIMSIVDELFYYAREVDLHGQLDIDLVDEVNLVVGEACMIIQVTGQILDHFLMVIISTILDNGHMLRSR